MSFPKITIVGTPFSTFTRTITLGLNRKGIPYEQIATPSHSPTADKYHPLGHLPTLILHGVGSNGEDIYLRESTAIVRYIDRIAPEPSLHLTESDGVLPEKMWEFVSIIQSNAYKVTEIDVIKIRVAKTDEGKLSASEIGDSLASSVAALRAYLTTVETLLQPSGFVCGKTQTWADYFLYPLLADLEVTPEAHLITPRLKDWIAEMKKLKEVKATEPGTLGVGARPPDF